MSVPQAEVLGVTLPDPELSLDPETGHYRFGAIDWDEFKRVISGHGPCNAERIARRRAARDDNAWVIEAATAYAEKHARRRHEHRHDRRGRARRRPHRARRCRSSRSRR